MSAQRPGMLAVRSDPARSLVRIVWGSVPHMDQERMHALVSSARIARLATIDPDGAPNVVPTVFALDGDTLFLVVDRKSKRTPQLQRLANLRRDPRATVLVDHYDEDWERLWWVRIRGRARVVEDGPDLARALDLLGAKYEQYRDTPIEEIAIVLSIEEWRGWAMRD